MKTLKECSQAELDELFRIALENQLKQSNNSVVDLVCKALEANRDLVKRALQMKASLSSLRTHLSTAGVQCSNDCLREALMQGGFRRAKSRKNGSTNHDSANGDNAP